MITIRIGNDEVPVGQADPGWVNQQIHRRREAGGIVCVQVSINEPDINMLLRTPACAAGGGGGGRPPNRREQRIFELWHERGLDDPNFSGGAVVAFLHQVTRLI